MKPLKKSLIKFLESRARWNAKIQANAISDEDVRLIMHTSVLGELCYLFLHYKKPKHYRLVEATHILEKRPNLFLEYISLEKKYYKKRYKKEHADLITASLPVLKDMYRSTQKIETFTLIALVCLLEKKETIIKPDSLVTFTVDLIASQPKEAIEAIVDLVFFQTNFGQNHTTTLDADCISELEKMMLGAIKNYDFLFVAKLLRMFAYTNVPASDVTKKAVRFLRKSKPRKRNLELEVITSKGRQLLDEDTEMVKLNKEIVVAVLEWKTNFRFYRDLGKEKKLFKI